MKGGVAGVQVLLLVLLNSVNSHCTGTQGTEEAPRCFEMRTNWQAKIIRIVAKVNGGIALVRSELFPVR